MIITHANRNMDLNHTSWAEIAAFHSIYTQHIDKNALLLDYEYIIHHIENTIDVNKLSDMTDSIMIFITGHLNKDLLKYIKESENELKIFFVVEDPNWPTYIEDFDFYYLITPFRTLQNKSCQEIKDIFNDIASNYHFDGEFEHIWLPFGNMMHESEFYIKKFNQYSNYPIETFNEQCYLGSLKQDRTLAFRRATIEGTDFYGNFNEQQLTAMLNIESIGKSICRGKTINPYVVPSIYSQYKKAVYMPDNKMIYFDSCYLRTNELAIANIEINPTANYSGIKQHLEKLTTNNKFDKNKIINEYGLVSDHLYQLKRRL